MLKCSNENVAERIYCVMRPTLQRQHYVMFLFQYGYRHPLCVKSFMFFELQIVISVIIVLWSNRLIE
jgi:hypothetical protein